MGQKSRLDHSSYFFLTIIVLAVVAAACCCRPPAAVAPDAATATTAALPPSAALVVMVCHGCALRKTKPGPSFQATPCGPGPSCWNISRRCVMYWAPTLKEELKEILNISSTEVSYLRGKKGRPECQFSF